MKAKNAALTLTALLAFALAACGGGDGGDDNPFGLEAQTIAEAPNPVSLTFAPDGRLFFAEKYSGNIRVVDARGALVSEPFAHVDAATWLDYQGLDWGLTGIALDPDFATNHYVYAFYTEAAGVSAGNEVTPSPSPGGPTPVADQVEATQDPNRPIARPVLVRFTARGNVGTDRTVIIGDFPESRLDHQGFKLNGALRTGPDDALYLSVGDYDWGKDGPDGTGAAADLSFPGGKILRIDTEGGFPPDNPFVDDSAFDDSTDSRIFAYGFSRAAPLAFHPATGDLYAMDATDSCEEIDIVQAGRNYGWPDVGEFPFSDCYFGDQVRPVALVAGEGKQPGQFQSVIVVSGLAFVSAAAYPALGDGLLVCSALDGLMRRLTFTGAQVTATDIVVRDCDRDVAVAPDGTIYYSNQTGIIRLLTGATPVASP